MKPKLAPARERQFLFLLSLLVFLELSVSGVVTLLISPDPKNALVFGFSALRLLLVVGIWILAIIVLAVGIKVRNQKLSLDSVWLVNKDRYLRQSIYVISFALIVWGWLSLFCPAYLFGRQIYIFERIQPFSIALGASLAQSWLFFLFARGRLDFHAPGRAAFKKYYRPTLLFMAVMFGLGIFMASTKFGLLTNLVYANVPGIPLSGLQFFFILLLVGLLIAFFFNQEEQRPSFLILKRYRLIPILIFLTTVLVWGFTPLLWHWFSLMPAAPSYQPFPHSDARFYDLGGISILHGYGFYFHQSADKPLFMVFMAVLHFLAGSNYTIMTWMQILVLAFIPVILYYLGVKFHGPALGILLSLILIIRQRNAIVLSYKIFTINPKLFMTEEMTLLGVALFAYLVFIWMRDRKIWLALLCGGCIGAASLLRLNPLFLFPAVACLIVPAFWSQGRKFLLVHLSTYTLAFLVLLVPWIFSSINSGGTPWLWLKYHLMIDQRYTSTAPSAQGFTGNILDQMEKTAVKLEADATPTIDSSSYQDQATNDNTGTTTSQNTPGITLKGNDGTGGNVYRLLYHFLHNFSASVMSIPDSLRYDNTNHLSQRIYWIDGGGWRGDLPVVQTGLIFLNLVLIAIGLGYSWIKHRWAGMIPMVIFIAYSLSLSVAMSSGGRYIVPIDWVPYFYYGLAIVVIVQFIYTVLAKKVQSRPASPDSGAVPRLTDRRKLGFSLVGIICLASLIPVANFVLPAATASNRNRAQVDVEAAMKNISMHASSSASIIFGEILYPYYEDGLMTFYFLTPNGPTSYAIDRAPGLKVELNGGERAIIVLLSDNEGNSHVESIYLWQDAPPELIWRLPT